MQDLWGGRTPREASDWPPGHCRSRCLLQPGACPPPMGFLTISFISLRIPSEVSFVVLSSCYPTVHRREQNVFRRGSAIWVIDVRLSGYQSVHTSVFMMLSGGAHRFPPHNGYVELPWERNLCALPFACHGNVELPWERNQCDPPLHCHGEVEPPEKKPVWPPVTT